jgi:hypothetical protein
VGLLLSRLLGATRYKSQSRRVDVGRKSVVNSREICKGIAEFKRGDNSEKRGILVTNRLPVHAGTRRYGQRCCAPAISLQVSLTNPRRGKDEMVVYIFKDTECVDEYTLPTCSFDSLLDDEHWNNFGRWLFSHGYLRPTYRIVFR